MAVTLAFRTMFAIDDAIEADQGASFRQMQGKVLPHIGDAYRANDGWFRSHLGASLIGTKCARAIWYGWRWTTKIRFPARILRLFNRGHLEEGRIIALLLMIGSRVVQQDENGKQFTITHAQGHFGGSGDGVVINLPDLLQGQPALLEFKTHGEKSFHKLAGKDWQEYYDAMRAGKTAHFTGEGVRLAKPEHYVQMQCYLRKMGLACALYVASNKNTDALYMEIVTLDIETADAYLDRGEKIIFMDEPPKRLSQTPSYWECKFCDHRLLCHNLPGAQVEVNCRTCAFSIPGKEKTWVCTKHDAQITDEIMVVGCSDYARKEL